jgi:hypothetical protein
MFLGIPVIPWLLKPFRINSPQSVYGGEDFSPGRPAPRSYSHPSIERRLEINDVAFTVADPPVEKRPGPPPERRARSITPAAMSSSIK